MAKAFGQFLTIKEAQEYLLADWNYDETLPVSNGLNNNIMELYMIKKGKQITFWYSFIKNSGWSYIDADIFEITKDNKIIHIQHHENVDVDRNNRLIIAP